MTTQSDKPTKADPNKPGPLPEGCTKDVSPPALLLSPRLETALDIAFKRPITLNLDAFIDDDDL